MNTKTAIAGIAIIAALFGCSSGEGTIPTPLGDLTPAQLQELEEWVPTLEYDCFTLQGDVDDPESEAVITFDDGSTITDATNADFWAAIESCGDDENALPEPAEAPAATPIPEPAPAPVSATPGASLGLGDDPYFNRLADRCDNGDQEACNDLYWESPVGSAYEEWALDRIDYGAGPGEALWDYEEGDDIPDAIALEALGMVWDTMPQSERDLLCDGVDLFGVRFAAEEVASGSEGAISVDIATEFIEGACG